jgi:hypothetical protein
MAPLTIETLVYTDSKLYIGHWHIVNGMLVAI